MEAVGERGASLEIDATVPRRRFLSSSVAAVLVGWAGARGAGAARRAPRIGFLANHTPLSDLEGSRGPPYFSNRIFLEGMRTLGWEIGRSMLVSWRSAESEYTRHSRLARELVGIPVDLIVAFSEGVEAAARATRTIPIVMGHHADPVRAGLVASLARPGGNVTGLAASVSADIGKSLSILKQAVPTARRIALLIHSGPAEWADRSPAPRSDSAVGRAAKELGVELFFQVCRDARRLAPTIRGIAMQGADAVWVEGNYGFYKDASAAATLAQSGLAYRLPIMQAVPHAMEQGALMVHGPDDTAAYRRVPYYVDRILRGASPAELPVEQPTRVELHVNLRAARAIGLRISDALLVQADHLIR